MWLEVPPGPPQPSHLASITAEYRDKGVKRLMRVAFDAEEAATLGRRLLDWASRADIVTAVNAVGAVQREDGRR